VLLDEHKAKLLLSEAGIPVPEGVLLRPEDIEGFSPPWPGPWFLKGLVLSGGRGRAGLVVRVEQAAGLAAAAKIGRAHV
jgi:succinyl-CoA synthetase alpha subunit